jgi:ankyrin repeat protein
MTPLHQACSRGHLTCVRSLLRAGASVKLTAENHDTALHLAAYAGNVDVVDTVLDYCAKIDACNEVEPRVV